VNNRKYYKQKIKEAKCPDCGITTIGTKSKILCSIHAKKRDKENREIFEIKRRKKNFKIIQIPYSDSRIKTYILEICKSYDVESTDVKRVYFGKLNMIVEVL